MKKLSEDARQRFVRISKKLSRRLAKARARLRRKKRSRGNAGKSQSNLPERILAPMTFSLESNDTRAPVMNFLSQLRKTLTCTGAQAVTIDFSRTDRFISSATLLFYAELSRLIQMTEGRVRIRCKPPVNDRASEVLHQIGVYEMCGQHVVRKRRRYDDVVHWRVAHGSIVDNSICAPAIEEFEGQLAPPLVNGLFRGLGEAMTNAIHHAYLDVREDNLNYRPPRSDWWMFSQARAGYLSVVFCDLGIGIPRTLPLKRPGLFEKILALGRASSDGACIEYAIEDTRTRTLLPERGKGLGNIVDVVSGLKGGVVMVLSNHGFYLAKNGAVPKIYDLKDSILGTLIYWRVPLAGA